MEHYICITCGTQYPASTNPPVECPTCLDERQYVGYSGQKWTTHAELSATHCNVSEEVEPGLISIVTEPGFAIGQRAMLVLSPQGNTLWDSISLLDDETIAYVKSLGGIRQIAVSHPHFYSSMIAWSHAFDAPIYLHEEERQHVMRPDPAIRFWQGETLDLGDNQTLIRCGGHFEGAQVLHVANTHDAKGMLLTSDIIRVNHDRHYVSFMYSYPNLIPLSASKVRRIVDAVAPYNFDRIHGGWRGADVRQNAKAAVALSAERYIRAITDN